MAKISYKNRYYYLLIPLFFWIIPYAIMLLYGKLQEVGKGIRILIATAIIMFFTRGITSYIIDILSIQGTYHNLVFIICLYATGIPWTFFLIKKYEQDRIAKLG